MQLEGQVNSRTPLFRELFRTVYEKEYRRMKDIHRRVREFLCWNRQGKERVCKTTKVFLVPDTVHIQVHAW